MFNVNIVKHTNNQLQWLPSVVAGRCPSVPMGGPRTETMVIRGAWDQLWSWGLCWSDQSGTAIQPANISTSS